MAAEVGENAIGIALKVARALVTVGAEYFLGGSLASSLQGEPRATNDIDFVISLPLGKVGELSVALGDVFEVDTDSLRDAVLRARCANAFYLQCGVCCDQRSHKEEGSLQKPFAPRS